MAEIGLSLQDRVVSGLFLKTRKERRARSAGLRDGDGASTPLRSSTSRKGSRGWEG